MTKKRKSFLLHIETMKALDLLSDEQAGGLFKAIRAYHNDEKYELDGVTNIAYLYFCCDFKRDEKKSRKGSNHWNWKGGISSENAILRNSSDYKNWRKDVFERDNYTCQKCIVRGVILHAHHVKPWALYPALRFDLDNGVTLCKECHLEVHRDS